MGASETGALLFSGAGSHCQEAQRGVWSITCSFIQQTVMCLAVVVFLGYISEQSSLCSSVGVMDNDNKQDDQHYKVVSTIERGKK